MAVERLAGIHDVAHHEVHAEPRDQLEGLHRPPAFVLGQLEQGHRVGRGADGGEGDSARGQEREQLQAGGGDHAKRPLGPDEQLLEVIAGVVLPQPLEAVEHLAVGQHRFHAQDEVAHGPVAQHRRAARVGRDQAADRGRTLRGQRKGKASADRLRRFVHHRQGDAGLRDDHVISGLDLPNGAQPVQRQQDLPLGDLAGDQAGVATLGSHRRPGLGADADHGADVLDRPRQHQQGRHAAPAVTPFDQLGAQPVRILAPAVGAQHGLQA